MTPGPHDEDSALCLGDFRAGFGDHPTIIAGYVFGSAATGEWRNGYSDCDLALFWRDSASIDYRAMQAFVDEHSARRPSVEVDLFSYTPDDLPFASRFFQVRFLSEARHLFGQRVHETLNRPDSDELMRECSTLLETHVVLARTALLKALRDGPTSTIDACYKLLVDGCRYWSVGHGGDDTSKAAVCRRALERLDASAAGTLAELRQRHGGRGPTSSRAEAEELADRSMRILETLRKTRREARNA